MKTLVTSIAIFSLLLAITPISANNSQEKSSANGWIVFEPNDEPIFKSDLGRSTIKAAKSEKAKNKAKQKKTEK